MKYVVDGEQQFARPPRLFGRGYTRDQFITFDAARGVVMDSAGRVNDPGKHIGQHTMMDGSGRTYDTTGAFLVGELERLVIDSEEKLRTLRFDLAAGKVKNVNELHQTRKKIARAKTFIHMQTHDPK